MYQLLYKNLIFLVIFALVFSWVHFIFAGTLRLDIETTIRISICGNNIIDGEEVCDGDDLAGETCQSRGYQSGNLDCNDSCDEFDVSGCYTPPAPPPPFGGGGGYTAPAETKVNFTGKAYPKSTVTLLKDAQIVATTVAGTDATFTMSLTGLSAGNYIFSVYSEDNKGNRSSLLTFPVGVTFGVVTNVSGIFIAPTIDVDKEEVRRGENIAIFGQSLPVANITIQISSEQEIFVSTVSDSGGVYLYNFGTEVLDYGNHFTKSKSAKDQEISSFSQAIGFLVGTKTVLKEVIKIPEKGDLNDDKKVNLIDFSILAYWYQRPSPLAKVDLNNDGKINLIDFSIMAYYWTG